MTKIDRNVLEEFEPGIFYTDASTIGLSPGQYPARFADLGIGNKLSFEFDRFDGNGTAIYKQQFGICQIRVFND